MRFYSGSVPEQRTSPLADEGWRESPALGAKQVQNYGLVAGCAGVLLVRVLLGNMIAPSRLWVALLVLAFAVPLHELVHALTTPGWGLTDRTVIGFQRGKGLLLPYMYYAGIQPLWRFLFTGLTPALLLTGLPLVLVLFVPLDRGLGTGLGFLACFNIAISGGDLVNFVWFLTRLPLRSTVRGHGWRLLWKSE